VILQQLSIEPSYVAAWPPADWSTATSAADDSDASARALLALWMERAWRRLVHPDEQKRFVALYQELRGQSMSFDEALRATFLSVLMSSPFRYLAATSDPDPRHAQYAVASRLSFMLQGAPPDEELLSLAKAGQL